MCQTSHVAVMRHVDFDPDIIFFSNFYFALSCQVGMGRNKWLFALENGIVRYTKEVYVPPPRSKESKEVICQLPKGAVLYKTFINVVPTEEVGSFKLITML